MTHVTPSLLFAAGLALVVPQVLAAEAAATPPAKDAAAQRGIEQARAELQRAREELRRAAEDFARAAAALGRQSPMAFAYQYVADPDHAVLGLIVDEVRNGPEGEPAVRILAVTPNSGADQAGLQAGDVLLSVKGQPLIAGDVPFKQALHEVMAQTRVGDAVEVEYERDGRRAQAVVIAGRAQTRDFAYAHPGEGDVVMPPRPPLHNVHAPGAFPTPPLPPHARHGDDLQLCALNKELGEYFRTAEGVLVLRAPSGAQLALRSGDVIKKIDGMPVQHPTAVMARLFERAPGPVQLEVLRHGQVLNLSGPVPLTRPPLAPPPPRP